MFAVFFGFSTHPHGSPALTRSARHDPAFKTAAFSVLVRQHGAGWITERLQLEGRSTIRISA
jgi:hypothetical protein